MLEQIKQLWWSRCVCVNKNENYEPRLVNLILEPNPLNFLLRFTIRLQSCGYNLLVTSSQFATKDPSFIQTLMFHVSTFESRLRLFPRSTKYRISLIFPQAEAVSSGRYFQWDQVNLVWWRKKRFDREENSPVHVFCDILYLSKGFHGAPKKETKLT